MKRPRKRARTRSKDLGAAMNAVNRALGPFDVPTAAMAVCAVAGVLAGEGRDDLHRVAGLGANLETMVAAFDQTRKHQRRAKR